MFSGEIGWSHFAQICPSATVRLAVLLPFVPNSLARNPTVPPLEEYAPIIEACGSISKSGTLPSTEQPLSTAGRQRSPCRAARGTRPHLNMWEDEGGRSPFARAQTKKRLPLEGEERVGGTLCPETHGQHLRVLWSTRAPSTCLRVCCRARSIRTPGNSERRCCMARSRAQIPPSPCRSHSTLTLSGRPSFRTDRMFRFLSHCPGDRLEEGCAPWIGGISTLTRCPPPFFLAASQTEPAS